MNIAHLNGGAYRAAATGRAPRLLGEAAFCFAAAVSAQPSATDNSRELPTLEPREV